jgi:hypothetical protein
VSVIRRYITDIEAWTYAVPDPAKIPWIRTIKYWPRMSKAVIAVEAAPAQWESLALAAKRTSYAYQTFKKWKCLGKLPFPVYINNLVKPQEVDAWVESTRIAPCPPDIERARL